MVGKEISLVKATKDDWQKVLGFELAAKSEYFSALENEKDVKNYIEESQVFLVKLGNKIIGTASYKPEKDSAYLDGLTIAPEYRGNGYSKKAMALLMNKLKGFKKATIRVHPKNTPAVIVYLKDGFKIINWEENHFGDNQPRLFMEKDL
jgi:ribosomal protein S18 acetylase RimI-like enzyme